MKRTKILRNIRGFAIAIAIVLAVGVLISLYTDSLPEDHRVNILLLALPFVAVFVSIILAFICLIVVVAIAFEGQVPQRSYRPIEMVLIAGILLGVVGLFQGWRLYAYQLGFLLLLFSLLGFMVWSHLSPMSSRRSRRLPQLSQRAHTTGIAAAVIVWVAIAVLTASSAQPSEPYGLARALWDFKTDEQKAEIKAEAEGDYVSTTLPLLVLVSLMPAGIVYFGTREVAEALAPPPTPETRLAAK